MKAPSDEDHLVPWSSSHSLKLSEMRAGPTAEFQDWSIIGRDATDYYRELQDVPTDPSPETLDTAVDAVLAEDEPTRLPLVRIARIADEHPEQCRDAVSVLTGEVATADPAVQAEIAGICVAVGEAHPDEVAAVIDDLYPLLSPDTHPDLRTEVVQVVRLVAEHDAMAVLDAVPKLASVLKDGEAVDQPVVETLTKVAKVHPDSVVPVAPTLIEYVEEGSVSEATAALAALGYLSKPYPHVAEQTIPMATALLDADKDRLRANASGLLADLGTEYADELRSVVPQARELVGDDDEKVQANATSLLARVAETHPDAVTPATDALRSALDADTHHARLNACWALGYLQADQARDHLSRLKDADPNDNVRAAAVAGLAMMDLDDCPHCGRACDAHAVEMSVYYPDRVEWTCPHCDEMTVESID